MMPKLSLKPPKLTDLMRAPGERMVQYSVEVANKILSRVIEGETISSICRDIDMPHRMTIYLWIKNEPLFAEAFNLARYMAADHLFDEARHYLKEVISGKLPANDVRVVVDGIKWLTKMLNPAQYSDKLISEVKQDSKLTIEWQAPSQGSVINHENPNTLPAPAAT